MSIIKKPVITEKMTLETEKFNRYAFVVDRKANKIQIIKCFFKNKKSDEGVQKR